MKDNTPYDFFVSVLLSAVLLAISAGATVAAVSIQSQVAVDIELKGYNGLIDTTLFDGRLVAGVKYTIDTPYRGLALLAFEKGQRYPVILGEQSFTLKIEDPDSLPSFTGSAENEILYKLLTGVELETVKNSFSFLMVEAKKLLDSTRTIHTIAELVATKEKVHTFVRTFYQQLQHSDMLTRLIDQYFMMHEYVDFHIDGAPASDIQIQYKKAVVNGVGNWISILKAHIPEHEILNYCVSLYYNRSMVSLAHQIVSHFRDIAYCTGNTQEPVNLSKDLFVTDADGKQRRVLKDFGNNAVISFVSVDCSISMVETVIKARQLAVQEKDVKLIVAPLQELSDKHFAMRRMTSKENLFFINDDKWYKNALPKDLRLPLFVNIATPKL